MMRGLIVAGVSLLCYSSIALAEAPACSRTAAKVQPNFSDTPVEEVIEFFSQAACKQFVVSDKIRGKKLTLLSAEPLSIEEAYNAFEAALDGAGIAVRAEGQFLILGPKKVTAASPQKASSVDLTFVEGKSTTTYKLPAPGEGRPARFKLDNAEQSLFVELMWSREDGSLQYEIKRELFGKSERSSVSLIGTALTPTSGRLSLLDSSSLSLYLSLAP